MTVSTIYLANMTPDGEPVCYQLRKGFELLANGDGTPIPDRDSGQPVWVGEILVPGQINFGLDDRPATIGIKIVGGTNPGIGDLTTVRFEGTTKITAWYLPRARGKDARTGLTINAERVIAAPDQRPRIRGGMPAAAPDIESTFLGQATYNADTGTGECDVLFAPQDIFAVNGAATIVSTVAVGDELLMADVRPLSLRAYFRLPDTQDVGRNAKAELVLACNGFERRIAASNGRSRRQPEPVAAAPDTPAEG